MPGHTTTDTRADDSYASEVFEVDSDEEDQYGSGEFDSVSDTRADAVTSSGEGHQQQQETASTVSREQQQETACSNIETYAQLQQQSSVSHQITQVRCQDLMVWHLAGWYACQKSRHSPVLYARFGVCFSPSICLKGPIDISCMCNTNWEQSVLCCAGCCCQAGAP